MILGITGSFGTGKSTVARMFSRHGFRVIDVDKVYSILTKPDKKIYNEIKKEFGSGIILKNKNINRNRLKRIVFNDSKKLKKLNAMTHPLIFKEVKKIIKEIKSKDENADIALDIPLLIESRFKYPVDKIIVVKCSEKIQIKRIKQKKKKYSDREISQIIKSQMPMKEKIKHADFVVDNSWSLKNTKKQVRRIVVNLKS